MKKVVLVYGGIAGLIVGGLMMATWPLHEQGVINMDNGMLVGYTTMVIALSLIFFGVKSYRDQQLKGAITFGRALVLGLLITLVASILYAFSWEILYNTMAGDFMQTWTNHQVEKMIEEGATEQAVEAKKKEMADMSLMYQNPIIRFGFTLTEILPVGVLISLVCAALLRKKEFMPQTAE